MEVFISYADEDKEISQELELRLRGSGLIVHRDKSALRFGEDWRDVVFEKVRTCDVFILLWSIHASQSQYVMFEILEALEKGRRIFPCLLDEQPLTPLLEGRHWLKLSDLSEQYDDLLRGMDVELEAFNSVAGKDVKFAVETYRAIIKKAFNSLRILFMYADRDIDDAYIELGLVHGLGAETLLRQEVSPLKILESLETSRENIVIAGHPGTGKTSTLHYLMHKWSLSSLKLLPIFARLKDFSPKFHKNFEDFLLESFYSVQSVQSRQIFETIDLFQDYDCVVLLDGLDEVSVGSYETLRQQLNDFLDTHRRCRVILTTRITGFRDRREEDFLGWSLLSIAPLNQERIEKFVSMWFGESDKGIELLQKIQSPRISELATRAFLLALICLVFEDDRDIGTNRSSLYEQSTLYLEQSRLKTATNKLRELRREVLKEIALRFLQLDCKELDEQFLSAIVYGALNGSRERKSPKEFLEELATETGLLQNYGGYYGFTHQSFQEYYAALALKDMANGKDLLLAYCQVPQWEEPLRLYAGSLEGRRDQEEFITEIWSRNPALALRTATECHQLAPNFLRRLIRDSGTDDRLRMIETVRVSLATFDSDQAMRTTIETMQPLFEAEADSAVLYFGIQLLVEFDPDDTGGILRRSFFEKALELFDRLSSDLKYRFEFLPIPAGSFFMGDNNSADEIERPAHLVHISNFQMAKYQLTNLAYEAIMGESKRNDYSNHDNQPVVNMNWYDAYICALKIGCRLPTEAEWEYAARAGSQDNWCFGNDVTKLKEYANYEDSGIGKTWEVGTGLPNEWGLYDVHGNVWEWCQDWLAPYTASTQTNPKGLTRSTGRRVRRGGGHAYHARGCRCSFRWGNDPLYSFRDIGVRLARDIP